MPTELLILFVPWLFAFLLAMLFYLTWSRERHADLNNRTGWDEYIQMDGRHVSMATENCTLFSN